MFFIWSPLPSYRKGVENLAFSREKVILLAFCQISRFFVMQPSHLYFFGSQSIMQQTGFLKKRF